MTITEPIAETVSAEQQRPTHWQDGTRRRRIYWDESGVPRDQWQRPVIRQDDGSQAGYRRISTLAKMLSDTNSLMDWAAAQALLGIADNDAALSRLRSMLLDTNPWRNNRDELKRMVAAAKAYAGAHEAAETGTTIHRWTELIDTGKAELGDVPELLRRDVVAYLEATERVETLAAELFVVNDAVKAAGTLDRLARLDGHVMVADLKTGQWDARYPMAVEMQVATYARGVRYDFFTESRTPLHNTIDLSVGLLIHVPQGTGTAELYELDLDRGWSNVQLAMELDAARKGESAAERWAA